MEPRKRNWLQSLRAEILEEETGIDAGTNTRGRRGSSREHEIISQGTNQNFESMGIQPGDVGHQLARRLATIQWKHTKKYISDVIACDNNEELEKIYDFLREFGTRGGGSGSRGNYFFLICKETQAGHIHVAHDCSWSNKACRCGWKNHPAVQRCLQRHVRRTRFITELTQRDWENVLLYFEYKEHQRPLDFQIWVGGRLQGLPSGDEAIRWQHLFNQRYKLLGEREQDAGDECYVQQRERNIPPFEQIVQPAVRKFEKKRSRYEKIREQLEEIIKYNPCYPLDNIKKTEEFINNDFLMEYTNRNNVDQALTKIKIGLCNIKLKDFYDIYKVEGCNPMFSAGYKEFKDVYYNLEDSTEILNELLLYQFDSDTDIIKIFLKDLKSIVDREIPKMNTFCLYGPPSSGKNFFIDTLLNVCMNVAQFGSIINRNHKFAYQEAENRRLIYWNEPNYESAEIEQLKTICGGDNYTIQIKCKGDASVWATPVIVTTNNNLSIMYDLAFKDRVKTYKWNTASYLKNYKLKPHPLSFFELLIKHNIL